MSNSRIFCHGFIAWAVVCLILRMFGIEPDYTGVERQVAWAIIGCYAGICAVAFLGDRTKGEPNE